MKYAFKIFILGLCSVALFTCDVTYIEEGEEELNPWDRGIPPEVNIVRPSPPDSGIVNTSSVAFHWQGNNACVTEFRWRLRDTTWSDWSPDTMETFTDLDEGPYTFSVMGKYPNEDSSQPATRYFIVDAIEGPALMIRPRRTEVVLYENFTVQLMAEEVADLRGAHIRMEFNPTHLRVASVNEGSFWASNGGQVVFLENTNNDSGFIELDITVLTADPLGLDSTGVVATLTFLTQEVGTDSLVFDASSEFRDSQNNPLPLAQINGKVIVH